MFGRHKKIWIGVAGFAALAVPAVLIVTGAQAWAQSATANGPQFEVASIELDKTWAPGGVVGLSFLPGGRVRGRGMTTRWLIEIAYGVPAFKGYVSGGPKWLDDDRYDIEAEAEPGVIRPGMSDDAIKEAFHLMLRKLLADRFKLVLADDAKEVPVYVLTVAKGGPKLQAAAPRDCAAENARCHHISGGRATGLAGNTANMSDVADILSLFLDRPVQNETGITGNFDIQIRGWADSLQSGNSGGEEVLDPAVVPDIFTVLREQLGLKLEPQRRRIQAFVIKSIERPSEN
jgi:uncharacterized protein (TIGR03435 family)